MKGHVTVVPQPDAKEDQDWLPSPDPAVEYMLGQGMTMEEIYAQEAESFRRYLAGPPTKISVKELIPLLNLPPHLSRRSVAALLTAKLVAHAGRTRMWFYTMGWFRVFPVEAATKLALQWRDDLVATAKRIKLRPELSVITSDQEMIRDWDGWRPARGSRYRQEGAAYMLDAGQKGKPRCTRSYRPTLVTAWTAPATFSRSRQ